MKPIPSFSDILFVPSLINIVDIGANPINGESPPYMNLLKFGRAKVIGFEPNQNVYNHLLSIKGPNETYLPYAIGDGKKHTLNLARADGMTSLLEPDLELLDYFHDFKLWGEVLNKEEIETVRLDDIKEIEDLDYLKIDIQGAELMVFENAVEKLSDCLVIQTEVEFLPMYKNQPLFSEVEQFLRSQGFIFHRFFPLISRIVKPLVINNNPRGGLSQIMYADAVFIKNFMNLSVIKTEKLLKMASILHDIYFSFDIVLRILMEYDSRVNTEYAKYYQNLILDAATQ